jgi:3-methylfumaryl-CoA hydratase
MTMSEQAVAPADWDKYIGRSESFEDQIALSPARRLLATFDDIQTQLAAGDALPPAWHWLYFLSNEPQGSLARDGLAQGGGVIPPVAYPRRMFGGCSMKFPAPLPIGAEARKVSTLSSMREKDGRSGKLLFVDVKHEIFVGDTLCIEDTWTSVFREEGAPSAHPEILDELPAPPEGAWVRDVKADEPFLFRYSALTFNPHRIHYDRPYATGVEGYAGLVVHGPLLATLLLEVVRRHTDRRVTAFSFRAMAPVYDIAPFRTQGVLQGDGTVALEAIGPDGKTAMTAVATLE